MYELKHVSTSCLLTEEPRSFLGHRHHRKRGVRVDNSEMKRKWTHLLGSMAIEQVHHCRSSTALLRSIPCVLSSSEGRSEGWKLKRWCALTQWRFTLCLPCLLPALSIKIQPHHPALSLRHQSLFVRLSTKRTILGPRDQRTGQGWRKGCSPSSAGYQTPLWPFQGAGRDVRQGPEPGMVRRALPLSRGRALSWGSICSGPWAVWTERPRQMLCRECSPPVLGGERSTLGDLRRTCRGTQGKKVLCK